MLWVMVPLWVLWACYIGREIVLARRATSFSDELNHLGRVLFANMACITVNLAVTLVLS